MKVCPACGHENSERAKFCEECAAPLEPASASREQRKTVTVLFCDVTGSTALGESTDPEALRAVLARYFERMKGIVESHGGTVEKFIGDAVMAVFGVPQVHEDDTLRACRAAVEMRDALPELGVQARIGVNTGEVVTGTEERLATGDAVNVAARLEQAAEPGEILMGENTLALVRGAVEAAAVAPLELKGKAQPVAAHRLVALLEAPERSHKSRFVGREREVEALRAAWNRAVEGQRCELVTVLGDAGVGKSRLVAEALATLEVRVVRGRCLPYGRGITYWPVVEVLKQLDGRPADGAAAAAIGSLLGETDVATSPDEIAWAVRKLLEAEAPLACVFDDVHWAEETLLDLVDHVSLLSSGAPILLVCMARPELLEHRQQWPVTVRLEPLAEGSVADLIPQIIEPELRDRIAHASGGNPLFVQEMVAMASESNGEVSVPPTLQALLHARLDQLDGTEREVLERGAVEGEVFHRGSVQALSDAGQVTPRLAALVRKALIRPDQAQLPAEDAFRFRHLLVRDTAYEALPKASRAELHERFAGWLEEHGSELVELDEILGYHFEQAVRYRRELGQPVDEGVNSRARMRLAAAGRRAALRSDFAAHLNLAERALELVPESEIDEQLEFDVVDAAFKVDVTDAAGRAQSLAKRAEEAGAEIAELCGRVLEGVIGMQSGTGLLVDDLEAISQALLRAGEQRGDHFALYVGHFGLVGAYHVRALFDLVLEAAEAAMEDAQALGRVDLEVRLLPRAGTGRLFGSTPIQDLLAWTEELGARGVWHPALASIRAQALATAGRIDEARALAAENRRELGERGAKVPLALMTAHLATDIEFFAGDDSAAAAFAEEGCRLLEEVGDRGWLCTACAKLGYAYYRLGRLDEADAQATRSAEMGAPDDVANEAQWRELRARVLARRGEREEAERVAREMLTLVEDGDLVGRAFGLFTLGEVLELNGDVAEAFEAFESALEGFERKGFTVMVERARARRDALLLQLEQ